MHQGSGEGRGGSRGFHPQLASTHLPWSTPMDRKVSRDPRGPDEQKRPTTLDGTKSGCGSGGSGNGSNGIIGRETISFFPSLSLSLSLSLSVSPSLSLSIRLSLLPSPSLGATRNTPLLFIRHFLWATGELPSSRALCSSRWRRQR